MATALLFRHAPLDRYRDFFYVANMHGYDWKAIGERYRAYGQDINSAGQHLLAMINDILDISKVEAGKMALYLEDFDVPSMVTTVKLLAERNQ